MKNKKNINEESKKKSEDKKLWIILFIGGLILCVVPLIIVSETQEHISEGLSIFYGIIGIFGFIIAFIGLNKLIGKKLKKYSQPATMDDYILAYGAYKYITHKKTDGSKSKLKDFTEKHPIITGAVTYSAFKKISDIKEEINKTKQEQEKTIITILTTSNKKKDFIIKETSNIFNIKIISLQPFKIETNTNNISKILEILDDNKIKYKIKEKRG